MERGQQASSQRAGRFLGDYQAWLKTGTQKVQAGEQEKFPQGFRRMDDAQLVRSLSVYTQEPRPGLWLWKSLCSAFQLGRCWSSLYPLRRSSRVGLFLTRIGKKWQLCPTFPIDPVEEVFWVIIYFFHSVGRLCMLSEIRTQTCPREHPHLIRIRCWTPSRKE